MCNSSACSVIINNELIASSYCRTIYKCQELISSKVFPRNNYRLDESFTSLDEGITCIWSNKIGQCSHNYLLYPILSELLELEELELDELELDELKLELELEELELLTLELEELELEELELLKLELDELELELLELELLELELELDKLELELELELLELELLELELLDELELELTTTSPIP